MIGIGAVIVDFNGVLVDDEAIHFALFREVLAQEGVVITERDYHERYLGYDDRGCFEAALVDAGQSADQSRLDQLIAQKGTTLCRSCRTGIKVLP
jgi:beta-phosphoglucomutase